MRFVPLPAVVCLALLLAFSCDEQAEESPEPATSSSATSSPAETTSDGTATARLLVSIDLAAGTPNSIAVIPESQRIYVTYNDIDLLTVIDPLSDTVADSVLLPPGGSHSVAVNTETNKLYITNPGDGSISIVDGESNTLVKSLEIETRPANLVSAAVAVNPNTNRTYVSWRERPDLDPGARGIAVIDGETDEVVATVDLQGVAHQLAVDTNTNRIFALIEFTAQTLTTCEFPRLLAVINGETNTVEQCLAVGESAGAGGGIFYGDSVIASDPEAGRLYRFSNGGGRDVDAKAYVIDLTTLGSVATASMSAQSIYAAAPSTGGERVFALTDEFCASSPVGSPPGLLRALDSQTAQPVWALSLGSRPTALAVDPTADQVYVATAVDRRLHVIEDGTSADTGC